MLKRSTATMESIERGDYADVLYKDGTLVEVFSHLPMQAPSVKQAHVYNPTKDVGEVVCESLWDLMDELTRLCLNPGPAVKAWNKVLALSNIPPYRGDESLISPTSLFSLISAYQRSNWQVFK